MHVHVLFGATSTANFLVRLGLRFGGEGIYIYIYCAPDLGPYIDPFAPKTEPHAKGTFINMQVYRTGLRGTPIAPEERRWRKAPAPGSHIIEII